MPATIIVIEHHIDVIKTADWSSIRAGRCGEGRGGRRRRDPEEVLRGVARLDGRVEMPYGGVSACAGGGHLALPPASRGDRASRGR
jgi:hypothetical protein